MNKYWTTDPTVCLEPVLTYGAGGNTPRTVIEVLKETVSKRRNEGCLYLKRKENVSE